jgi:hypothetical protein
MKSGGSGVPGEELRGGIWELSISAGLKGKSGLQAVSNTAQWLLNTINLYDHIKE